jgi:N-acetylmuramoyl-L-alanine amidase CwlA
MKLIEALLPIGKDRPGIEMPFYNSITIHWIGPYPFQSVYEPRQWWIDSSSVASAHFILKGDTVLLTVPTTEVAYHCGCKEGNNSSIGIEVIPVTTDGDFSDLSIQTLKELLGILRKVELKRHYDWTGKDCPLYYTPLSTIADGEMRWIALKGRLQA